MLRLKKIIKQKAARAKNGSAGRKPCWKIATKAIVMEVYGASQLSTNVIIFPVVPSGERSRT